MIYLIQSGNLYKIGYTTNLEHRFDQYKQHNPTAILLDSKEGSRKMNLIHINYVKNIE